METQRRRLTSGDPLIRRGESAHVCVMAADNTVPTGADSVEMPGR